MTDGFEVKKQGVDDLATKVSTCATDLRAAEAPLRTRSCGSTKELGEFATAAFTTFFGAWTEETDIMIKALNEVSEKLRASSDTYQNTDQGGKQGLVQTLPQSSAPAAANATTMGAVGKSLHAMTSFQNQ